MEFKRFSAGAICYGAKNPMINLEEVKAKGVTNVNFSDPKIQYDLVPGSENYPYLNKFLEILAVCHTIIV